MPFNLYYYLFLYEFELVAQSKYFFLIYWESVCLYSHILAVKLMYIRAFPERVFSS